MRVMGNKMTREDAFEGLMLNYDREVADTIEAIYDSIEPEIAKLKQDLKQMDEMSADLAAIIVKRDERIAKMGETR